MFFVWGKMHTQEQKLGRFSHKKRAHANVFRRENERTKKEEKKFINKKNAPSALERHRSQI